MDEQSNVNEVKDDNKDTPNFDLDTLLIIQDGRRNDLSIKQIFDIDKYDTFKGVTYSASANFINHYLNAFKHISLITGAGEDSMNNAVYASMNDFSKNVVDSVKDQLMHKTTNLYQSLSDSVKEALVKKDFELLTPLAARIHSKFYLLSNAEAHQTRLIIGSANLSNQAFNKKVPQFESILIFDNNDLFDVFTRYFENELKPTTRPYFLKPYDELTKKKLQKKPKDQPTKDIVEYTTITPEEVNNLDPATFKASIEDLQHPKAGILLAPEVITQLQTNTDKAHAMTEINKQNTDKMNVAMDLVRDSISQSAKEPKFKTPKALDNAFKKHIHIEQFKDVNQEAAKRQADIISQPQLRTKTNSGLYTERNDQQLIPFGQFASKAEIKHDLEAIQHLMNNYQQYAIDADNQYCSRIMEAILYAFESPFLYEVRRKARGQIEGQDIPQFLFIGGQASSGKSSLLKILMKMMGIFNSTTPQLYTSIIPDGVRNAKSLTIKQLKAWIGSENVAPIIADEVPSDFFTNVKYGNDLVVDETNFTDTSTRAFPVFIGSTNSSNYSFPDRARRRSYYLANDKVFDDKYRQEGGVAYTNVMNELDSNLFNDFCMRFANLLLTKDEDFWYSYGKSKGLYDFLRGARLIFEQYYKECDMALPQWFPETRSNDEQESGKDKWKKLYEAHEDWFTTNPQNKKHMFFSINILNQNAKGGYNKMSPAEEYRNDLDPKVVVGNKNAMQIEINKERFFHWIGIRPKRKFFNLF